MWEEKWQKVVLLSGVEIWALGSGWVPRSRGHSCVCSFKEGIFYSIFSYSLLTSIWNYTQNMGFCKLSITQLIQVSRSLEIKPWLMSARSGCSKECKFTLMFLVLPWAAQFLLLSMLSLMWPFLHYLYWSELSVLGEPIGAVKHREEKLKHIHLKHILPPPTSVGCLQKAHSMNLPAWIQGN